MVAADGRRRRHRRSGDLAGTKSRTWYEEGGSTRTCRALLLYYDSTFSSNSRRKASGHSLSFSFLPRWESPLQVTKRSLHDGENKDSMRTPKTPNPAASELQPAQLARQIIHPRRPPPAGLHPPQPQRFRHRSKNDRLHDRRIRVVLHRKEPQPCLEVARSERPVEHAVSGVTRAREAAGVLDESG